MRQRGARYIVGNVIKALYKNKETQCLLVAKREMTKHYSLVFNNFKNTLHAVILINPPINKNIIIMKNKTK